MSVGGGVLYTPQVLALAVDLARYPLERVLPLRGSARSPVCGSRIDIGILATASGRIDRIGARVSACAIGQASAAVFLRAAAGRTEANLEEVQKALGRWLSGEGPVPDWPEMGILAGARDYPARHPVILLPWQAARSALCNPALAD